MERPAYIRSTAKDYEETEAFFKLVDAYYQAQNY